ncbi:MAG: prepilin-type N-terminal cleavage/methylation domain-containing protein [bacterium]
MPNNKINNKGFTLIEAIVYVAVFSLVVGAITTFLVNVVQLKNKTQAERATYQEARYIMERINNRIRLAPGIDTGNSVFDNDTGQLVLKSPTSATNLTTFWLDDGVVYEQIGPTPASAISSDDVVISQLRFNQVVSSDLQSSIQTQITAESVLQRADMHAESSLTSNASLRNDYPYEWIQTTWSGGSGQTIWTDTTKYDNDNGELDSTSCEGDVRLGTNKDEIVIWATDVCDVHGFFNHEYYSSSPDTNMIQDMPDLGMRVGGHFGNSAETSPDHYMDVSFNAHANTIYHFWGRARIVANGDAGTSDSFYAQFSDSLKLDNSTPVNRTGTSQGLVFSDFSKFDWKWDDIWTGVITEGEKMYFANEGPHTVRIQRREDGLAIDQIIISSGTFLNSSPAANTIYNRNYVTEAILESSNFDTGHETVFGQIEWQEFTPVNTEIKLQIKTAADEAGLAMADWYGPTDTTDYYTSSGDGINYIHDGDRWMKYRMILSTTDTTVTPSVNEIRISYSY